MKGRLLIVEDEETIREYLAVMLKKDGYEIYQASNGVQAQEILRKKVIDLVLTDIQMPEMDGLTLLKWIKQSWPEIEVIMITAFGSIEGAVEAIKNGAFHYVTKPFKIEEIRSVVDNALRLKNLESENQNLRKLLKAQYSFENIVGNSAVMRQLFDLIKRVSQAPSNVLIIGESGTGKELVARALHFSGPLKDRPFVAINCAAIPETLIESELFGHKKGAFTGADRDKPGLFEKAHTGTLFLDEIGELPLSVQVKLLRALQEKAIRRIGSNDDIRVDVRIIAATNRDLEKMVQEGSFRQDLYYRLNVIQIRMPPLRERKEDIPLLVDHFIKKFNAKLNKNIRGVHEEALAILQKYDYPGNVRELENIIERAMALETRDIILTESLPPNVIQAASVETKGMVFGPYEIGPSGLDLDSVLGQIEKTLILKALELTNNHKKKAAKLLHLTPRSLRYRLSKFGLSQDDESFEDD